MDITEQIKDNFNRGFFGKSMQISELPDDYPAWTIKQNHWVGVAVPVESYTPFSEQFSQVRIMSMEHVEIEGEDYTVLMLVCLSMELRNEFAIMCRQFVEPGKNGQLRRELTADPRSWWKHWKDLLGNVATDRSPYDILGELIVLEKLLLDGKSPEWTGIKHATHDIEMENSSIEVKSTTARYGYEVTISSLYQMRPTGNKPLELAFIRFEKSALGRSIDDLATSISSLGYDHNELESSLAKAGLETGRVARSTRYKVLEWKHFPVDDTFPSVTESSFKNDRIPQNVIRFTYTVDLSGVPGYSQINIK